MPTYEYICKSCAEPTEHFASMSAKPLKKCPHCGKNQLERQIGTGAGFIFKGGGFYETDYRSDGYKKAAKEDKAPAEGSKAATGESSGGAKDKAPAKTETKSGAAGGDGKAASPSASASAGGSAGKPGSGSGKKNAS